MPIKTMKDVLANKRGGGGGANNKPKSPKRLTPEEIEENEYKQRVNSQVREFLVAGGHRRIFSDIQTGKVVKRKFGALIHPASESMTDSLERIPSRWRATESVVSLKAIENALMSRSFYREAVNKWISRKNVSKETVAGLLRNCEELGSAIYEPHSDKIDKGILFGRAKKDVNTIPYLLDIVANSGMTSTRYITGARDAECGYYEGRLVPSGGLCLGTLSTVFRSYILKMTGEADKRVFFDVDLKNAHLVILYNIIKESLGDMALTDEFKLLTDYVFHREEWFAIYGKDLKFKVIMVLYDPEKPIFEGKNKKKGFSFKKKGDGGSGGSSASSPASPKLMEDGITERSDIALFKAVQKLVLKIVEVPIEGSDRNVGSLVSAIITRVERALVEEAGIILSSNEYGCFEVEYWCADGLIVRQKEGFYRSAEASRTKLLEGMARIESEVWEGKYGLVIKDWDDYIPDDIEPIPTDHFDFNGCKEGINSLYAMVSMHFTSKEQLITALNPVVCRLVRRCGSSIYVKDNEYGVVNEVSLGGKSVLGGLIWRVQPPHDPPFTVSLLDIVNLNPWLTVDKVVSSIYHTSPVFKNLRKVARKCFSTKPPNKWRLTASLDGYALYSKYDPNTPEGRANVLKTTAKPRAHILNILCNGNASKARAVEELLARSFRQSRGELCIIFYGPDGGEGKSGFVQSIGENILGDKSYKMIEKVAKLGVRFNTNMVGVSCILIPEIAPDKKDNQASVDGVYEMLKQQITESTFTAEKKHGATTTEFNFNNIIGCTNSKHAIPLVKGLTRRIQIYRTSTARVGDTAYMTDLFSSMASDDMIVALGVYFEEMLEVKNILRPMNPEDIEIDPRDERGASIYRAESLVVKSIYLAIATSALTHPSQVRIETEADLKQVAYYRPEDIKSPVATKQGITLCRVMQAFHVLHPSASAVPPTAHHLNTEISALGLEVFRGKDGMRFRIGPDGWSKYNPDIFQHSLSTAFANLSGLKPSSSSSDGVVMVFDE